MRNPDPVFWPEANINVSLSSARNKNYTDCINILQTQWYQADVDQRFAMGDQDIWGLIFPGVATYRRKIFNFNLINSTLQMISGYQRRNRKSTICIPTLSPMQKTADQLTKCLYHVHSQSGAYQVYSDCFEQGALTQGLGFVSIYNDFTNDPISGDVKLRYIDMKSCLFDPYFRKHDLSDCSFFWTRQFFGREEAALLYSAHADAILSLPKGSYRDDKFYYMPEVYQIQFPNLIAFDEYWYLSSREATYLADKETGEVQEFEGDEEDLKAIMHSFRKELKVIKKQKPTVRRSIILNDKLLIDEPNPYGLDCYPYVPMLGYFTPDSPYYAYKFRGVVRDLRDTQYLFNRLKVSDLDILESQQQGLKVREGSLVTPQDSQNQGHGRVLTIKKTANMADVEHMPIIPPAPTMLQMEEMLQQTFSRISGVNETMLGTDINDKAGIISMLRNSAGITTLTRLFDQFDESQRLCGEIITKMIQKSWTYGKIKQVIGEEPTAEFDNKAFFRYGCKVIQAGLTESQQQLSLQEMLHFREVTGVPITNKSIIKASTLQNKEEIISDMQEEQKAQQEMQMKMAQLQMEQMQIDNQSKISYAKGQEGLAAERVAKIRMDMAIAEDKLKKSHQEDTHSLLNLVKGLKEVEGMKLDHVHRQVETLGAIQDQAQRLNQPLE